MRTRTYGVGVASRQTSDDRARALSDEIRALLGSTPNDAEPLAHDLALAVAREQLESQIAASARTWPGATLRRACTLLGDVDALQREREEDALRDRLAELGRVQRAVQELGEQGSAEAIQLAPAVLCETCSFGRGMVSAVVGSLWLPRRLFIDERNGDHADEFHAFVERARIPLGHTLLEAELVRRRVPALVADPLDDDRTFKDIVHAARSSSNVVAPVKSRGRAIGFFHGDRARGGSRVGDIDRDRIAAFASCFGLVYEQAVLRERLADQHRRSRDTFGATEALLLDLEQSRLDLAEAVRTAAEVADAPVPSAAGGSAAARVHDLLTSREREVLALMSEGATNTRIAEHLVIAEGTVKSHVKNILRKLHAPTRAAAVARYAHLTRRPSQHA